jgi:hypothetical protein
MTATTALTAQNTQGVYDIHNTPPEFVVKQIDACINDIGVDVVKTGELFISNHNIPTIVMDDLVLTLILERDDGFSRDYQTRSCCSSQTQCYYYRH